MVTKKEISRNEVSWAKVIPTLTFGLRLVACFTGNPVLKKMGYKRHGSEPGKRECASQVEDR